MPIDTLRLVMKEKPQWDLTKIFSKAMKPFLDMGSVGFRKKNFLEQCFLIEAYEEYVADRKTKCN